jgi:hypothetical protein
MALVIRISNWSQSSSSSWNWKVDGIGSTRQGLALRLEAAHQQPADFFLVVDEAVRVAHHRQHRVHARDAVGDDVEVLGRVQRHVDAGQRAELARPLAGAVDHVSQRTSPCAVRTPTARPFSTMTPVTSTPSTHLHAAVARALGQRHAQVGRIGLAVAGQPDGALQVVGAHHRVQLAGLRRRDLLARDAEAARQRHLLAQHLHALGRARHVDAAALLPAGGQAGLLLQRGVQLDAVAAHRVMLRFGRIWPTSPAACQVVPLVSLPCSSSSTSVQPALARW